MKDRFLTRYYDTETQQIIKLNKIINCCENGTEIEFYGITVSGEGQISQVELDKNDFRFKRMQCTGLKDKNGKLIYELDIVKINEKYIDWSAIDDFYRKQNFVVEYSEHQAKYIIKANKFKDNSGDGIYDLSPDFYEFLKWKPSGKLEYGILDCIEVIGNIWEDKDLLKGGKE